MGIKSSLYTDWNVYVAHLNITWSDSYFTYSLIRLVPD